MIREEKLKIFVKIEKEKQKYYRELRERKSFQD